MSASTEEIAVKISSSERSSGTVNDFTIDYPNDRFVNRPKKAKIISVCLPYTWFNIVGGVNNTLIFNKGGTDYVATIAAGNYTGITLAAALQLAMTSADPAQTYTVAFSDTTYVFAFTANTTPIQLNFTSSPNLATVLGFSSGALYPVVPALLIESTTLANLLPDTFVEVCSNLIEGIDNGVPVITSGPAVSDNVMAHIIIKGNFGQNLAYVDYGENIPPMSVAQSFLGTNPKGRPVPIRFFLRFSSGFPIDLNGKDWGLVIKFYF
jgi:hypothetical protein